jgi:hypothetical protein
MAREGLGILQNEIQPEMANYLAANYSFLNELRVLVAKLNASFLHIFVLFDHTYQTKTTMVPNFPRMPHGARQQVSGSLGLNAMASTNTAYAYITPTIDAFNKAEECARRLLPGSHPLRLSVKLEYSAFLHDCTRDYENARNLAKRAIDEALSSMDAMDDDDDAFEDYMERMLSPFCVTLDLRRQTADGWGPFSDGQPGRLGKKEGALA